MKQFLTLFLLIPMFFSGCATVEIKVQESLLKGKPKKILLGYFEERSLSYNPYLEKNFRDSLRFEFYKLNYECDSLLIPQEIKIQIPMYYRLGAPQIKEYCQKYSADVFIQGSIFEGTVGDAIDSKTSSSVLLILYNREGEKVGEAQYLDTESLATVQATRDVASSLSREIHSSIKNGR